jgi:hypothetical protein
VPTHRIMVQPLLIEHDLPEDRFPRRSRPG